MKNSKIERNSYLSKSMYIRGLQCAKSMYLYKYYPNLREVEKSTEAKFESGHEVGKLAQQLFSGGIDCGMEHTNDIKKSLSLTSEALKEGKNVIYEAAFQYKGMLAFADIMVKEKGKWNLYEVKSSVKIKEYQLNDVTIQYYILTSAGIEIKDFSIVHINSDYIKSGKINLKKFFIIKSVKEEVKIRLKNVEANIKKFKKILNSSDIPSINIGPHCTEPYGCDFYEHCWKHVPEYSVLNLSNMRGKQFELYNKGIIGIKDIPENFRLSANQKLEINCYLNNNVYINKPEIKKFLNKLKYPLYFLDFETVSLAIPIWYNSRPYQKIPFQYSLYYKRSKESKPEHSEFLEEWKNDPRIPFIKKLLKDTKSKGTILAYNISFEKQRLEEIARDFPKYKKEIDERISRMADLIIPFRSKHYYKPEMKGSYSLKYVLPAVNPIFGYDDLEIQEGESAGLEYEKMLHSKDDKEIQKIRKNLLEYCERDTYAMILLLIELENI